MVHDLTALRRMLADESGGALVEAALVLPVVLVIAFVVVMVGRVARAEIGVHAVAREAARTLATSASAADGIDAAQARAREVAGGYGLSPDQVGLTIDAGSFARGGTVSAGASYRVGLGDLPLLGTLAVTVSSTQAERVDLYRSRTAAAP